MRKRSYNFKNENNDLICVFRLDIESVTADNKMYSVGFFHSETAKFIGRVRRCFESAEDAQKFLDCLAHSNTWSHS